MRVNFLTTIIAIRKFSLTIANALYPRISVGECVRMCGYLCLDGRVCMLTHGVVVSVCACGGGCVSMCARVRVGGWGVECRCVRVRVCACVCV